MSSYFDNLNPKLREYFNILSHDIPEFLYKYLEIPELQRLKNVGYFCGMDYCSKKMYDFKFYYSRFDHSVAVALMTWHFTHDEKQTIAALLHDIASPAFSHVIDYMNGDILKQESTEKYTKKFIMGSKELKDCLKQDGVKVDEVVNCKDYSIVDNDRPKLCADRLDSLFMINVLWAKKLSIDEIKTIYNNISVMKNESNEFELGTSSIPTAREVVDLSLNVGYITDSKEDRVCMQLLARIIKLCIKRRYLHKKDLYKSGELEILNKISEINSRDIQMFLKTFFTVSKVEAANEIEKIDVDNFYVSFENKKKHVNILTNTAVGIRRASRIDLYCHDNIELFENYIPQKWAFTKRYK